MPHSARSRAGAHEHPTVLLPTREEAADVRLVVVDMDGTLLDGAGELPDGLGPVLDALHARGIVFAPASGRQYAALRASFDEVSEGMVFIAENGALVVRDDEELMSSPIDAAAVHDVVGRARDVHDSGIDSGIVLSGKQSAYIERDDESFVAAARPYYSTLDVVPDLLAPDGPLHRDEIVKIAVYDFGDAEHDLLPALQPLAGEVRVVLSSPHWVDLMQHGVDKGAALRRLQTALEVSPEQTMAFGDFRNDLEMLAESRFSVAMANAHPDVLAASAYVAPPNTDRGVLRALDAVFGLGMGLSV